MNAELLAGKPWLAFSLLGVGYALLGWYLAAHHVFWLVGTLVGIATLAIAWKSNPMLEFLAWLVRQRVFVVIGVSFLFSLFVALIPVQPVLLSLIPLPLITLLYALLEMRLAGFQQSDILIWSVIITGFSLGLGEAIDLFVAPSMRY
ncbi:hypothetical protein [Leptolyngbya sp. FACHB-261]|uniref:hypothetical protein n=1 Tax=Leptolyngbya sp. FACHB-261 TaxID=2692806 RepID=UPI0016822B74|nr:hypothetical protein [Leptolyngbya sp. FACHB-261]MBD2102402.1 hypothetical protein [Leptolyngbya sp. FACHB-261]